MYADTSLERELKSRTEVSLGFLPVKGDEGIHEWEWKCRTLDGNREEMVLVLVVSEDAISLCWAMAFDVLLYLWWCNRVLFFSCQLRLENMLLSQFCAHSGGSWRAAFPCYVWLGSFPSYKKKFGHGNRAVLGFAADSIEHFLMERLSFPSTSTWCVLPSFDSNEHEPQKGSTKQATFLKLLSVYCEDTVWD